DFIGASSSERTRVPAMNSCVVDGWPSLPWPTISKRLAAVSAALQVVAVATSRRTAATPRNDRRRIPTDGPMAACRHGDMTRGLSAGGAQRGAIGWVFMQGVLSPHLAG